MGGAASEEMPQPQHQGASSEDARAARACAEQAHERARAPPQPPSGPAADPSGPEPVAEDIDVGVLDTAESGEGAARGTDEDEAKQEVVQLLKEFAALVMRARGRRAHEALDDPLISTSINKFEGGSTQLPATPAQVAAGELNRAMCDAWLMNLIGNRVFGKEMTRGFRASFSATRRV